MDTFEIVTEYWEEIVQACNMLCGTILKYAYFKNFSFFFFVFKHVFSIYIAIRLKGRAVFKS